jgi:hypothetical protein
MRLSQQREAYTAALALLIEQRYPSQFQTAYWLGSLLVGPSISCCIEKVSAHGMQTALQVTCLEAKISGSFRLASKAA